MSSETLQPRSSYGRPNHEDNASNLPNDPNRKVYLRHPGYNDGVNILMALPALDHSEGGIHHETARLACAVLANNQWDGFLSESRTGPAIQIERDGILRGQNYFFRIPGHDNLEKYAIVPSFFNWRFPHDCLPTSWTTVDIANFPVDRQLPRQSSLAQATLARDVSCRITNHIEGTEHAHLVPRSEERWFGENGMFSYPNQQRPGTEPIDDAQNAILLRSDIHTIFDQKRFAIIPKSSAFTVHIVAPGSSMQLANLYHNVALQPLVGVAVQYLFSRFAWTVFAQLSNFLQQGLKRTLCTYAEDGEIRVAEFSGDQCKQIFSGKSRSQSPQKRQRDVPIVPAISEHDTWKHRSCRRSSSCDDTRGRKKVRCSSSSSRHSSIYGDFWSHSDHSGLDLDFGEDTFDIEQKNSETVNEPKVDSSSTSTRLSTDRTDTTLTDGNEKNS